MASKIPDINKAEASIDALYKRLESVGISDARAWVAMSNLAQQKNPLDNISDPDKFLSDMNDRISFLLSVASTRSKLARAEKEARRLMPPEQMAAVKGKGALSPDEVWERLGWKSVEGGGKVWSRPPDAAGLSEWFPPQFSRYIADYNESPEAAAASSAIASDSPMLPVTMEKAKEMREEDRRQAERNRFLTMMDRDIRSSLSVGDDDQYALGANTGVHDDFSYLREEEEEQTRRNIRRNRTKRSRRAAVALEGMDDYERFIHENKGRFGRDGAEQVFRQRLLKELPPFFKDSKLSTKALIAMNKSLSGIKKTPLVGPMLGRMIQNPVAGVSAAIYGATVAAFAASDKSNATVTGWQNAVNLYGMPSKEFQNAAYLAGLKDPGEISRLYGKLTAQFGDPEAIISSLGPMMGRMSDRERTLVASSIPGMDEMTVAIIDMMSKNGHLTPDQSRRIAANKSKVEAIKTLGSTSEAGVGDSIESAFLSIPGMSGAAARDMESTGHVRKGFEDALDVLQFENIQKNIKATGEAAESLNESESSGGSTTNNNVSNNSHAVYINKVDVNTNNPEDFIRNMEGIAESTSGSHANILNSMDSRVMV